MMMRPMAIGMFVVPVWNRLTKPAVDGTKCPMATPIAIARKIQSVRKRSRNESFLRAAGAQICPCVLGVLDISTPRSMILKLE